MSLRRVLWPLGIAATMAVHAPSAAAAPVRDADEHHRPQAARFVIHETVERQLNRHTFTSSSPLLCPSGVFSDRLVRSAARPGGHEFVWTLNTTYTCADGSGQFTAVKHLLRVVYGDNAFNAGRVRITGGTGRYADLRGHGFDIGARFGDHGEGVISGHLHSVPHARSDAS